MDNIMYSFISQVASNLFNTIYFLLAWKVILWFPWQLGARHFDKNEGTRRRSLLTRIQKVIGNRGSASIVPLEFPFSFKIKQSWYDLSLEKKNIIGIKNKK